MDQCAKGEGERNPLPHDFRARHQADEARSGQEGAERVLDILNLELRLAMVGCGARSIKEITAKTIIDRRSPTS